MQRAILLLAAALTLTACKVEASVNVTMQPDGSGSIALTVTADREVVDQAPGLADDLRFDDATAAGWLVTAPAPTADGGLQVVLTHEFATAEEATALLRSLNGAGGPLHEVAITQNVTDNDITTALTGVLKVDGGLDAFADPDVLAAIGGTPYLDDVTAAGLDPNSVVTFRLTADLPGKITKSGVGTTPATGDGLEWTVPMDGTPVDLSSVFVQAQGQASSGWGLIATIALILLVLWVIAATGFIAFVAKARRQRAMRRPATWR
ncbi:MAG: hypothetical protein Q7V57_08305 [Actinomycetota bacterium]|nr:hypothetical protein [Actinomycetota bacterium]